MRFRQRFVELERLSRRFFGFRKGFFGRQTAALFEKRIAVGDARKTVRENRIERDRLPEKLDRLEIRFDRTLVPEIASL